MRVAIFDTNPQEQEYIKNHLAGVEVSFFTEKLSQDTVNLAADAEGISVFIDSQVTKDVLVKLPKLKFIATRSTGFDHIDLGFCRERKITVSNVPHYGHNSVAEHAFALILNFSRNLYESIERTKQGSFSFEGLTGFDLNGKTLGVIGLGNIGQHVVRIARGFEMQVLGYDVAQDKKLAKRLGFTYASLEDLLKNSDIVTLHAPYSGKTRHLLNAQNMPLMKKGSYLINTARGGLVDTTALMAALENGTLAGAGLDVLEEENFLKEEAELLSRESSEHYNLKTVLQDHMLLRKKNVMITPHNAFNSKESLEKILETTVLNIQAFANKKPINQV